MVRNLVLSCCVALLLPSAITTAAEGESSLLIVRVPENGVQPQLALDADGNLQMIYLRGKADEADIAYVRSIDGGQSFSKPLQVNSQPGSAIAIGTIRGPHLALGKNGRAHVAWMGSSKAEPKGPGQTTPLLYTRLNAAADGFEPQKNVVQKHAGLDGGGSLATDDTGRVLVTWHAPEKPGGGEAERRVWVARSADDGQTFDVEIAASSSRAGACGCCGMRAFVAGQDKLWLLFRSAAEVVHRDMLLVQFDLATNTFRAVSSDPLESATCVMSTAALARRGKQLLSAWETNGQIHWAMTDLASAKTERPAAVPGAGDNRKHPALAVNSKGEFLLVWAEGTGWNRGGAVAWQAYYRTGKPNPKIRGRAPGLAVWGLPAAFAKSDDSFVIVY